MRWTFGIAGLSAKKSSSGSAGVLPSSRSALSPRSFTQSGSPTGATAARPSSAPRKMIVSMRGSRPSARASFGRNGQANRTPAPPSNSRRVVAWKVMTSPPLEFRRHQDERDRLLPAFGASHGPARVFGCKRPERILQQRVGLDPHLHHFADAVGDIEPLRQPVDPGRLLVGESLR